MELILYMLRLGFGVVLIRLIVAVAFGVFVIELLMFVRCLGFDFVVVGRCLGIVLC